MSPATDPGVLSPRPTLRTLAAALEVSATTVSLALRRHPRISAAMRARVQKMAAKLGYRPDPQVVKLMHHLRTRRKAAYQATIAALTSIPEGGGTSYMTDIVRGAADRAQELGYGFSIFRFDQEARTAQGLQRMLASRGIQGVLFLPIKSPRVVTKLLDWRAFATISTTYGVIAPHFHRVVPHQFGNALLICERLAKKGYRRIGLVLSAEHDVRVHHGFSAAVAWQNLVGGTELVRPLIHAGEMPEKAELARWFKRERPDAILTGGHQAPHIAEQLELRVPGPVAFAIMTKADHPILAGIDERPEVIGAMAVEQLAGMIQRGETGLPKVPMMLMVDGHWVDGPSARVNRGKRAALKRKR